MLKISKITVDGATISGEARYRVSYGRYPVFGWNVLSSKNDDRTLSACVSIRSLSGEIWNSGETSGDLSFLKYEGPELPSWEELYVTVRIKDIYGETAERTDWFYSFSEVPPVGWITAPGAAKRRPVTFSRTFSFTEIPSHIMVLYSGIGYASMYVNGMRVCNARLDPAFTDYSKRVGFIFVEGFENLLRAGDNEFSFVVADGWRNFDSPFIIGDMGFPRPPFDGINQLGALIVADFARQGRTVAGTDETWKWSYNNIIESSIYDGEKYDARLTDFSLCKAAKCEKPCEKYEIMQVPPVTRHEVYFPKDVFRSSVSDDTYIVDFGQNIAGVTRLKLPEDPEPGRTITLRFSEVLDEEFELYTAPLRKAKATDVYICRGGGSDGSFWQPEFTFHGFRYCSVSGYGDMFTGEKIEAVSLYTDLPEEGYFSCGSPFLNALHKACVQTEKSNIHSILTDCPQRDERMGWMNDATVRFEETPYNFDVSRIFPKIVDDICDTQDGNGTITDTAPFVIGARPADPVCSSFLIAGYEYFKRSGNVSFVSAHYDNWRRWEEYLLSRSDGYIAGYSYYGDWAAPAVSCVSGENAASKDTPGILMSTGYSYLNCIKLSAFAKVLGLTGDEGKWLNTARKIRAAFIDKWFDCSSGKVAGGSQGSQVFALKLGLIPDEYKDKAFSALTRSLSEAGNTFTTGNLNTRYLFDVLTEYGRADLAYDIIRNERYPGYGFMLENGATTIWERFELKKEPGMNSHNHPMYASVDMWFYRYVLGISQDETDLPESYRNYVVKPCFPEGLLSAQGKVGTALGTLSVRWKRTYGKTQLSVSVPFGMKCRIEAGNVKETVGSGDRVYEF